MQKNIYRCFEQVLPKTDVGKSGGNLKKKDKNDYANYLVFRVIFRFVEIKAK